LRHVSPQGYEEAAEGLRAAAAEGLTVRTLGARTKASWGALAAPADVELEMGALDGVLEHNAGDLTAVLQAGAPLAAAQQAFAEAGQMLALDPPLGPGDAATIGGVMATDDSGPLRHRYGGARDLVIGVAVALSDGTVARSGGKVIKNVAGYDLAKLLTGSFGTLGAILEVAVRLHPRPDPTATAVGRAPEPAALAAAGANIVHAPVRAESVDIRYDGGTGMALARFGGAEPAAKARRACRIMAERGLEAEVVEDDEGLWAAQRAAQRSAEGVVVRVAGTQSSARPVLEHARTAGARAVVRPGLGLSFVAFEGRAEQELLEAVAALRDALAPAPCVVLDAPADVRARLDVWGELDRSALALMRRVKARFDAHRACSPGIFVGGI
jgi:glycolate oxidase FAD binding subunit